MSLGWLCFLSFILKSSTQTSCLDDVESVVDANKTGVLIKLRAGDTYKCLAVSNETFPINGTVAYKIIWRNNCSRGDLWQLTWTNNMFRKQYGRGMLQFSLINLVRISLLQSDWGLEWATMRSDKWVFAYLIKRELIMNQGLLVSQSTGSDDNCTYVIEGIDFVNGQQQSWYLLAGTTSTGTVHDQEFMNGIEFAAPTSSEQTCNLENIKVKNGEIDTDVTMRAGLIKVIMSRTITFRCYPGYGVKEFNNATVQEIECYNAARLKECEKIELPSAKKGDYMVRKFYVMLVITLSILFVLFLVLLRFRIFIFARWSGRTPS